MPHMERQIFEKFCALRVGTTFAQAIKPTADNASGALPKCTNIEMYGNPASDEAQQAVEDAIASRQ